MADDEPSLTLAAARPYAYTFPLRRTALVLIDLQRDFVDPGGFGAIQCGDPAIFAGVRSVVPAAQAALAAARRLGLHVLHTREGHAPDLADLGAAKRDRQTSAPHGHHTQGIGEKGPMGRLLVRGEYGHDLVDELQPRPGEVVIDKPGKGSFWNTDLHRHLMARGITHLLIGGVTTECCVATTAREANDRGFQFCVLDDCTGGFDAGYVSSSLAMLASFDGLFGFTAPSAELLTAAAAAPVPASAGLTPPPSPPSLPTPVWDGRSLDVSHLSVLYSQNALTPEDVVRRLSARIDDYEQQNPHVWIYRPSLDQLVAAAQALTHQYAGRAPQERPPLYGIPFAVKDNFDVAGLPTTAGCAAYTYTASSTGPVVASLLAAGALLVGKTNMDQLATGLSGCRSPYGTPASVAGQGLYVSGGSSSGSGVAVAAQLVTFSLGTDTAGSGRVPAALNGIVGYKPTKGTLSGRGIVPACQSLDTASVFALSAADARRVWLVVDEHDAEDDFAKPPDVLPKSLVDYRGIRQAGFVAAVPPREVLAAVCTPAYLAAFDRALQAVQSMGGRLATLDAAAWAPFAKATQLLYSGSLVNERISCIGRDFVLAHLEDSDDTLHPTTRQLFRNVVQREGRPWDVFADQSQQREAVRRAARLLERPGGVGRRGQGQSGAADVLLVPTTPFHPRLAEMAAEPIALNARLGEFTHFGNVLDLSAISVPVGTVDDGTPEGAALPFGLSLVCAMGQDGYLFDLATELERTVAPRTRKA